MSRDLGSLARSFDQVASKYHAARPDYPPELFAALIEVAGITVASRLLEVGCGTGKATAPLARRGFSITAVEPGAALAAEAAARLATCERVKIVQAAFEQWAAAADEQYDVVYAATSWHWLDAETRYALASRVTRPEGSLAIWSANHVFPEDGDPFFGEVAEVYEEIGEGVPDAGDWPRPGHLPELTGEIESSGHYGDVRVLQFDWEVAYDESQYLALLDTFSGHILMQEWQRARLYGEIRRRFRAREEPLVRRHWGAALHVATRMA